jgi:pimeloyl-ACP methyl ester carboxylesterase
MKRAATRQAQASRNGHVLAACEGRITFPCLKQTLFLIIAIILLIAGAGFIFLTVATTLFLISAVIFCAASTGYIYQIVATALDKHNYPPPGKLVNINGNRLHVQSVGTGSPTVILEAGLCAMSSVWGWIQPEVAKFTRVVSYDRAGLGWSKQDNAPFTALHVARQLHDLLKTSGIESPYVIVGHSMGGLLVRMFADQYPDNVAGMVLLDASHPDQYAQNPAIRRYMNSGFQLLKKMPLLTRLGYVRISGFLKPQAEGLPARQRAEAEVFLSSHSHFYTVRNESSAWDSICAEVRCSRSFGNKPLAVLSAGRDLLPGSLELQAKLATLSSDSTHHVVKGATHESLVTHREHAMSVVDAIRKVVEKVRKTDNADRGRTDDHIRALPPGRYLTGENGVDILKQALEGVSIDRIRNHIKVLEGIRHPQAAPEALERAADYIRSFLQSLGYEMTEQLFKEDDREFRNVIASRCGVRYPEQRVMVLAHYDTVSTTPGADDNASGVAVLLELAEVLKPFQFERSVQFVGVNLEENARANDSASGTRGSRTLATHARENDWAIEGVVVLESVAYAGDSVVQSAPAGIPIKVPEVGNFIAVVGNENSARLIQGFARAIERYRIPLPYQSIAVPGAGEVLPDTRRSDHAPFWDNGYKAIMITDTTDFRNPHYHKPGDTLETLNLAFAAEVCRATGGLVLEIARCSDL